MLKLSIKNEGLAGSDLDFPFFQSKKSPCILFPFSYFLFLIFLSYFFLLISNFCFLIFRQSICLQMLLAFHFIFTSVTYLFWHILDPPIYIKLIWQKSVQHKKHSHEKDEIWQQFWCKRVIPKS